MLLLNRADIEKVFTTRDAIDAVKTAFKMTEDGKIVSPLHGVRPTLDFAEETALLVGNANVKIKRIAR